MQHTLFDFSYGWPVGTILVQGTAGIEPATIDQVLAEARRRVDALPKGQLLDRPHLVRKFLEHKLHPGLEYEVFGLLLLNMRHELIEYQEPFRGTHNQASVYPREVVKIALQKNAAACVIAHNHPSGALEPSQADRQLTIALKNALALIDVRLLDHVLVAGGESLSFAERGFL